MTINARYLDTCPSCYLQDHHNRPGEMLVSTYLGDNIHHTASQMVDSMDMDAALPAGWTTEQVAKAIEGALEGVDLRPFDEHGNRLDAVPDNYDGTESQVWVLLTWDASVVKMRLTVDVEYQGNGVDPYQLKLVLENLIRFAAGDGALQGGTDAVVTSWGATALDVTNEPEPELRDERLRTVQ